MASALAVFSKGKFRAISNEKPADNPTEFFPRPGITLEQWKRIAGRILGFISATTLQDGF
ncbi:hypothetical protein NUH87_13235 [Pseudomonas batumici]